MVLIRKRVSLVAKMNFLSISLVLCTALIISFFFIRNRTRQIFTELVNHGITVAQMASQNSEYGIYTQDQTSLQQVIDSLSVSDDIAYVSILDDEMKELTHRILKKSLEKIPDIQAVDTVLSEGISYKELLRSGSENGYLDFLEPVIGGAGDYFQDDLIDRGSQNAQQELIGYIRVGLTKERYIVGMRSFLLSTILFTSLMILMGILATVMATRKILSPVKRLNDAANRISEGNFNRQVKIDTNDEIADLSKAFNRMLVNLQNYQAQVEMRTRELTNANEHLMQEIIERKNAEDLLLQAKHDWEDTFNAITDMITIHDKDFNILRANAEASRILGLDSMKSKGRAKCYKLFHKMDSPPLKCPASGMSDNGKGNIYEVSEPVLDRTFEIRTMPRYDKEKKLAGIIHIARDISEKKRLEAQLRHAQKMEAVGTLAGGIAHDFNNILTAITSFAGLVLMEMPKEDRSRRYVEEIVDSAERAAMLTQSLLAYSRKQIINPRPVNINLIVSGVKKLLSRLIGEEIEMRTILRDNDLMIMADKGQLEQVLINLVTNSKDAMPNGGTLSIELKRAVIDESFRKSHGYGEPGIYAHLSVTDTGEGMDEETKNKIFEPFYTTKAMGKGTGLGLAIVYGIIKQHNGYINIYSEPNKGTVFNIFLPVIETAEEESDKDETEISTLKGYETVLLAEDDDKVRMSIKNMLEKYGYTVIEAIDGKDAISKFRDNRDRIQLLILDVIMPNMNGKEAYDTIREENPVIKAILMSGYTADIINKKGVLEEKLNFITKPVQPLVFLKKLRRILDGRHGQQPVTTTG